MTAVNSRTTVLANHLSKNEVIAREDGLLYTKTAVLI
jgi:hypothetical protein